MKRTVPVILFSFLVSAFGADYAEKGTNIIGQARITSIADTSAAYVPIYDTTQTGTKTRSISVSDLISNSTIPSSIARASDLSNYQPFSTHLTDLSDGTLTGSKVGTGINAGNVTTGTLPDSVIPGTITRDSEWDTIAEVEAIWGVNILTATELDSQSELEALIGVSLATDTELATKQDAFATGVGITNVANVLSANLAAGANISFTTNAGGSITIAATGGGGGGGTNSSVFVNGVSVSNPNLTNSLTALVNASSTNVTFYPTNLANAQISASAAIDATKIATGAVSNTEFQTLDGVTSAIQTQIDGKAASTHAHAASDITSGTMATARLGSGTANSTTILSGDSTFKQIADAQVASGAAIAFSKLSGVAPATSGTSIQKGNGSGGFSSAVAGTDYAPATPASTAILRANGSGGFNTAIQGTDYAPATSGTGVLKGNGSGGFSTATPGTDYYSPGNIGQTNVVLRANSSGNLAPVTIGSNLSFDGTTLSAATATGISGTVINSGTPLNNAIPVYSGTTGTNITPSSVTIAAGTNLLAGNITSTNGITTGATGTAGALTLYDTDASNSATISPNPTTTTDVNFQLPAAPFSGIPYFSVSSTTNWVPAQLTIGSGLTYSSGTLSVSSLSGDNWSASGSTNSTLAGSAAVYSLTATNGISIPNDGSNPGTLYLGDNDNSAGFRITAHGTTTTNVNLVGFQFPPPNGSALGVSVSGTNVYLTNLTSSANWVSSGSSNSILSGIASIGTTTNIARLSLGTPTGSLNELMRADGVPGGGTVFSLSSSAVNVNTNGSTNFGWSLGVNGGTSGQYDTNHTSVRWGFEDNYVQSGFTVPQAEHYLIYNGVGGVGSHRIYGMTLRTNFSLFGFGVDELDFNHSSGTADQIMYFTFATNASGKYVQGNISGFFTFLTNANTSGGILAKGGEIQVAKSDGTRVAKLLNSGGTFKINTGDSYAWPMSIDSFSSLTIGMDTTMNSNLTVNGTIAGNISASSITSGTMAMARLGGGNAYVGNVLTPWPLTNNTISPMWRKTPQVYEFSESSLTGLGAVSGNGGTTSFPATDTVDWGAGQISTGTQTNGFGGVRGGWGSIFTTNSVAFHWRILTPSSLSTDVDGYQLIIGTADVSAASEPTDGAYFFYTHSTSNGVWTAKTSNNSSRTFASGGAAVTVTAGAWWDFFIEVTSSVANFWVSSDGGATFQFIGYSTSNIPSSAGRETGQQAYIVKTGGSTGTNARVATVGRMVLWPPL